LQHCIVHLLSLTQTPVLHLLEKPLAASSRPTLQFRSPFRTPFKHRRSKTSQIPHHEATERRLSWLVRVHSASMCIDKNPVRCTPLDNIPAAVVTAVHLLPQVHHLMMERARPKAMAPRCAPQGSSDRYETRFGCCLDPVEINRNGSSSNDELQETCISHIHQKTCSGRRTVIVYYFKSSPTRLAGLRVHSPPLQRPCSETTGLDVFDSWSSCL
jgi:hypothetical protein